MGIGGSYLSRPVTTAISEIKTNEKLAYGASSMQGWRVRQEDAHNCILEFDEDTAFFAVYDGHGGSEVAIYTSEELPNFLKSTEKYSNGHYREALIDAFLGFDDTIPAPEVLDKLKELRDKEFVENKDKEKSRRRSLCGASGSIDVDEANEDEEDVSEDEEEFESAEVLRREATRPIEEVVAAYREGKSPLSGSDGAGTSSSAGCSSSSLGESSSSLAGNTTGSTLSDKCFAAASSSTGSSSATSSCTGNSSPVTSIAANAGSYRSSPSTSTVATSSSSKMCEDGNLANGSVNEEPLVNGVLSNGDIGSDIKEEKLSKSTLKEPISSASDQPSTSLKKKKLAVSDLDDAAVVKNFIANDEISENDEDDSEDETFELSNNDVHSDEDDDDDDEDDEDMEGRKARGKFMLNRNSLVEQLTRHLRRNQCIIVGDSDDSDDDEEDEEGNEEEDEDAANESKSGEEEEDEEAEDEEEVDAEEESNYEDDSIDFFTDSGEQPGVDSGCTAVVALIKGDDLYVANAGDSRCVICKNGVAVDMSEDHKPEDELESARVKKAGGKVQEGRVNGGLNLSRAIGDHRYKKNPELPNTEQMITALPDVKVAKLESDVEFIVLACDGIWNSLSSQEVVDFIRLRIKSNKSLSDICEELFHECLAPNTFCDGTGCDNMTCIIVKPVQGEGFSNVDAVSSSDQKTLSSPSAAIEGKPAQVLPSEDVGSDSTTTAAADSSAQEGGDKEEQQQQLLSVSAIHSGNGSPSEDAAAKDTAAAAVSVKETAVSKGVKRPNNSNDVEDDAINKRSKTDDVTLDDSSCANSTSL